MDTRSSNVLFKGQLFISVPAVCQQLLQNELTWGNSSQNHRSDYYVQMWNSKGLGELEDAQIERRVMFLISAGNLLLNHAFYIKCEREKHNKRFPTKRCLDDFGPIRERRTQGKADTLIFAHWCLNAVKGQEWRCRSGHLAEWTSGVMTASECASQRKEGSPQGPSNPIHSCQGRVLNFWKENQLASKHRLYLFYLRKGPLIFLMMQPASCHITVKNMAQFGKCRKILKRK